MIRRKRLAVFVTIPAIIFLCLIIAIILTSGSDHLSGNDEKLDPEVLKLIKDAPLAESYPDADVIYLLDETEHEIFDDGSSKATVCQVYKILTESGKEYADCQIGFNSSREKISLLHARTITPDGKVIPLKKNAMQIVTPYSDYPEYSDYQELTFSLPGVQVGSIIDYQYTEEDEPSIGGKCLGPFYFQVYDPNLFTRLKITAPASMKLNYLYRNPLKAINTSPAISTKGSKKIYLWEYSHIPQIFYEDAMPPEGEIASNLMVTAMDSWEEFFRWWQNEVKDKTESDAAIKKKVEELTKSLSGIDEKMAALFDYVKREIRYVSIGIGASGYVPASAQEVFANKYGDCKDMSTLLICMLRAAGITAHYVLIPTFSMPDLIPDFPHISQFNHCIVAVEKGDGYHYLDPTASEYRFDYLPESDQNRNVVVFKDTTPIFKKTPLLEAQQNTSSARCKLNIGPEGAIRADAKYDWSGGKEASLRSIFIDKSPTEQKEFLQEKAYSISPDAKLVDYAHSDPLDFKKRFLVNMTFDANTYCEKAGDLLIFLLPIYFSSSSISGKETRRFPILFDSLGNQIREIEFNVPDGYEVYNLPERVDLDTPYFTYRSGYRIVNERIIYEGELTNTSVKIPAAEFDDYRNFCQIVDKSLERHLIFRKKKT